MVAGHASGQVAGRMAGRQDGTPLAEAAALLGLSPEATRKRLQRGTLDGYKVDNQWYVVLPRQDASSGQMAGRQDGQATGFQAVDRPNAVPTTPAEVERAIEATASRYMADFAGLYDRISADVGARYQAEIAAKDETIAVQAEAIADLRRQLAEAQSAPPAAPQPASAARTPSAATDTPDAPGGAGGLWARVRRAFGREG